MPQTTTIPPIQKLLISCCKSHLSADEIQYLISKLNSLDHEPNNNKTWQDFLNLVSVHGVLPLAYQTIYKYAKDAITPENFNILKQGYMATVGRNMLMSAELIKVMALLEENGIEALTFKGPALAQMAYGDTSLRAYSDLDILIRKEQQEQAIELLKSKDYEPAFQMTPAQYKSYASISHDYCLYSPRSAIPVELHWRLFSNEFMVQVDDVDFFSNPSEVFIQGKAIKSFNTEQLLVYLATHGAKHQWERMEWLVDIARVIEKQSIDWDCLINISEQTKSLTIVLTTLKLCQNILDTKLPATVEGLTLQKSIQRKTKSMQSHLISNLDRNSGDNIRTKTISMAQLQQLTGIKNKLLLLTSILKPTPLDFESAKHPENMTFLYYFSRPMNVFRRWKGKFFKNQ